MVDPKNKIYCHCGIHLCEVSFHLTGGGKELVCTAIDQIWECLYNQCKRCDLWRFWY